MRKYLMNAGVLTAVGSGYSLLKAARTGPRDWRLLLLVASWGIGVALAVGAVQQQDEGVRDEELERELAKRAERDQR